MDDGRGKDMDTQQRQRLSYEVEGDVAYAVVPEGTIARVYGGSPLGDHDALLVAGRYPMRPMTVGFATTTVAEAYWFSVVIPGTYVHDCTWSRRMAGDATEYHPQPYGYIVRGER